MEQAFKHVLAFHRKFRPKMIGTIPAIPSSDTVAMRVRLIKEEIQETLDAIDRGDLPEIADGIGDSIYVLIGVAVSYGIDLPAVWDAIQEANMAKVSGPVDAKVVKPPGWQPPDIAGILERQHPIA